MKMTLKKLFAANLRYSSFYDLVFWGVAALIVLPLLQFAVLAEEPQPVTAPGAIPASTVDIPPKPIEVSAPVTPAGAVKPSELSPSTAASSQPNVRDEGVRAQPAPGLESAEINSGKNESMPLIHKGTGVLIKPSAPKIPEVGGPGDPMLAFESVDIREFVKNVLFDILGENYNIDPQVSGTATIRTVKPVPKGALIGILETILRMNNAILLKENGIYKVMPVATGIRGSSAPQMTPSGKPLPAGYSVQIVPLKYIGVREMYRILEPFMKDPAAVRIDELRNVLYLSGTERELRHLLETIDMFDVDLLAGMSAGLFPLKSADVKTVSAEIEKIFGGQNNSPLAGLLRIVPIERLNALLIMSPQPHMIDQAKSWIERLDKLGGEGEVSLHVYHLQYGRADKIAPILSQLLTGRAPAQTTTGNVAPGQAGASLARPITPQGAGQSSSLPQFFPGVGGDSAGGNLANLKQVQIAADKDNNALIVLASAAEYSLVESALRKMDIPPKQVLIEAQLARVSLTDDFRLGLQWFILNGSRINSGLRLFGDNATPSAAIPVNFQGFAAGWLNRQRDIQTVFNMIASDSRTTIISTPQMIAQDNQPARIQVGSQVPILSQSQTASTTGITQNNIQYKDTGIIVEVTPRINFGGQVTLELNVELSNVAEKTIAGLSSPIIDKTTAKSTLTIQSGESVLLGGLIEERKANGSKGLPLLSKIPVLGGLFGEQNRNTERSEILIMITPKVIEDTETFRLATEELRGKMRELSGVLPAK